MRKKTSILLPLLSLPRENRRVSRTASGSGSNHAGSGGSKNSNPRVSENAAAPPGSVAVGDSNDREEDDQDEANDDSEPIENSGSEILAGRVIDQAGFPVGGLSIVVTNRDNEINYSSTIVTGSGGRFEQRDILGGEFLLRTISTENYPSVSLYVRSGNTAATLTVNRLNRIAVAGIVSNDAGQLLAGDQHWH